LLIGRCLEWNQIDFDTPDAVGGQRPNVANRLSDPVLSIEKRRAKVDQATVGIAAEGVSEALDPISRAYEAKEGAKIRISPDDVGSGFHGDLLEVEDVLVDNNV
jgi:hypothetical protein